MKEKYSSRQKHFIIICVLALGSVFYGCGREIVKNPSSVPIKPSESFASIKGKVVAPLIANTNSSATTYSLSSVQGTTLYVEELPHLTATADASGKFEIKNVPLGRYALIAEKNEGYCLFRQRQDNIVSSNNDIEALSNIIPLEPAIYSLVLHFSDINDDRIINPSVTLWGKKYQSQEGTIVLKNFPSGSSSKEASLTFLGYANQKVSLSFGESRNSELYIRMAPSTGSSNFAPVVYIEQSETDIYVGNQVRLTAVAYDPEGETPKLLWSCSDGQFTTDTTSTVVYYCPPKAGNVEIVVTAKDGLGAQGKAVLHLSVKS